MSPKRLQDFEGSPLAPATPLLPAAPPLGPGLLFILFSAFVGGLLLNLMPCVLPVLSLKAISFVEQVRESRVEGLKLAAAFAAGVLFSFWSLAALVIALKHGGQAVGWGFQFQEPGFVLFMAALVLTFALNLFGVFEIWLPGGAMQGLSQASNKQGLAGAFGHGLVMTLLATPCSAPFLGTALGFAFTAPGRSAGDDLQRRGHRPGHALPATGHGARRRTLPAQARRLDGAFQGRHGLPADGHPGLAAVAAG